MQIPSVNDVPLQNLVSGSLVRYRCMIQDLFDPEFFLSTYEIHNVDDPANTRLCCSLYRDVINCEVKTWNIFLIIFYTILCLVNVWALGRSSINLAFFLRLPVFLFYSVYKNTAVPICNGSSANCTAAVIFWDFCPYGRFPSSLTPS